MTGPDGGPWGIRAASSIKLVEALELVPYNAELWKIYTTGNLGVVVEGDLEAVIDLQTGEYRELPR